MFRSAEFLNLEGAQFSKSRNWAIWVPDFLSRYAADPLRYFLTVNAPETRDTEFTWNDFVRRNNDELVATWGNLVNRSLSFTNKHFGQDSSARADDAERCASARAN